MINDFYLFFGNKNIYSMHQFYLIPMEFWDVMNYKQSFSILLTQTITLLAMFKLFNFTQSHFGLISTALKSKLLSSSLQWRSWDSFHEQQLVNEPKPKSLHHFHSKKTANYKSRPSFPMVHQVTSKMWKENLGVQICFLLHILQDKRDC